MPNHVIGDMDSTQVDWNQVGIAVHLEQSQEATDCDKALALAQTKASEVTLIGVEGNRLDHVLSTLSSVAGSTLGVRLVLRRGLGHVIRAKQEGTFAVVTGQRFSVIPLQPCEGVHIAGGEWNLSDATLGMGHRVSISNRAIGDSLTISTRVGCLLAILETESPPKPFWT
jgi:thiamine pyrophosphokinase